MVFDTVLYPSDEILQIGLHLLGDAVRVETTFMGIADNRRLAIVGRNDDETVRGVEDIECGSVLVCSISED